MPTDNAAMEAINGWIKAVLFLDFHVTVEKPVETEIVGFFYIGFLNVGRLVHQKSTTTSKVNYLRLSFVIFCKRACCKIFLC